MIKVLLFLLLIYCVFTWGYGASLFLDIVGEIKNNREQFEFEGKSVYMAIPVMFILWIFFPIIWPLVNIVVERED